MPGYPTPPSPQWRFCTALTGCRIIANNGAQIFVHTQKMANNKGYCIVLQQERESCVVRSFGPTFCGTCLQKDVILKFERQFFRTRNPNAAFFLRDSGFLQDLPEKQRSRFVDEDPLAVQQLEVCFSFVDDKATVIRRKLLTQIITPVSMRRCTVRVVASSTKSDFVPIIVNQTNGSSGCACFW